MVPPIQKAAVAVKVVRVMDMPPRQKPKTRVQRSSSSYICFTCSATVVCSFNRLALPVLCVIMLAVASVTLPC